MQKLFQFIVVMLATAGPAGAQSTDSSPITGTLSFYGGGVSSSGVDLQVVGVGGAFAIPLGKSGWGIEVEGLATNYTDLGLADAQAYVHLGGQVSPTVGLGVFAGYEDVLGFPLRTVGVEAQKFLGPGNVIAYGQAAWTQLPLIDETGVWLRGSLALVLERVVVGAAVQWFSVTNDTQSTSYSGLAQFLIPDTPFSVDFVIRYDQLSSVDSFGWSVGLSARLGEGPGPRWNVLPIAVP